LRSVLEDLFEAAHGDGLEWTPNLRQPVNL